MTGTAFVDTNVLVYRRDSSEPQKQPRAGEWMEHLWNGRQGRLSIQVLNEFYVTVTQKLRPGLAADQARDEIRSLLVWRPVPLDRVVLEGAWRVRDRYAIAHWDSLIVSAAILVGSRYLLTEDLADGQVLDGVEVVNPFRRGPADLD